MGGSVQLVKSKGEFQEHLGKAKAQGTGVFVDFYAEWCGPCKMVAPKLASMAEEYPAIIFLKVDVDECQELSQEYGIRAMPTFIGLVDGKVVGTVVGANLDQMRELIEKLKPVAFSGSAHTLSSGSGPAPTDEDAAREARAKAAEARLAKA